jgi:hypothetical protein
VEIGSIQTARERIVEKEIESLIRESHVKQIRWLENKLGLKVTKDLPIWPEFVEICERRNLLTHTGGVVSSQYLEACREEGHLQPALSIGDRLKSDGQYYRRAVTVFLEFGSKLVQVTWRKILPEQIEDACSSLNELSYRLISKRQYEAASSMLKFGLFDIPKQGSDAIRKTMVINYANAVKLSGHSEQSLAILNAEDWSASTEKFKICVAAVKDDAETVMSLMKRVVDTEQLTIADFRSWPVFEKLRTNSKFVTIFEETFGTKIIDDQGLKGTDNQKANDIEGVIERSDDVSNPSDTKTVH